MVQSLRNKSHRQSLPSFFSLLIAACGTCFMMGFVARGFHQLSLPSQVLRKAESTILDDFADKDRQKFSDRFASLLPAASQNPAASVTSHPFDTEADEELRGILVGQLT